MFLPEQSDLENIFRDVVEMFLIPRFISLGMRATSEWEANVYSRVEMQKDSATGVFSGRDYSEQLQHGAPPGTIVDIPSLRRWAMAKFGYGFEEATNVAYAVRNSIADKGTTWYQQGGSNLLDVLSEEETLRFIRQRVGEFVLANVTAEISDIIKI